jgi:diguanylate cyclase (GGDEF)-like protein
MSRRWFGLRQEDPVSDPAASSNSSEAPGLAPFLRWMTIAAIVTGLTAGTTFLLSGDGLLAAVATLGLALGGWLFLVSQPLLRAGRTTAAVVTASAGLLLTSLVISIVIPQAALGAWVVPLLAVAMALHVLDQTALVQLMSISWAVGAAAALLAEVNRTGSGVPLSVPALLYIGGWGTVTALAMYLLAQLSTRVRVALDLSADANVALQAADDKLTIVNDELRHQVDELERHSEEMSLLAQLGDLLEACQTVEEMYAVIGRVAEPLFAGDAGALYELTPGKPVAEAVAVWGEPPPIHRVFASTDCWALRRGRLHVVEESDTELLCPHVEERITAGALCEPLAAQSETLGVLHLQVRRRTARKQRAVLLAERQRLAQALGEQLALALANFRLRDTLREQSSRDALTGLFNRRHMEESLYRELRRATREGGTVGVIMADLDHFKEVNDTIGHAAGDAILRTIGTFLRTAVRGEDIACRFGGEEFVIILPKASLEDTKRRAEKIRQDAKLLVYPGIDRRSGPVTLSLGVAAFPIHGTEGEDVLHAADEAVYKAKAKGRDRVVVAGNRPRRGIAVDGPTQPSTGRESRSAS